MIRILKSTKSMNVYSLVKKERKVICLIIDSYNYWSNLHTSVWLSKLYIIVSWPVLVNSIQFGVLFYINKLHEKISLCNSVTLSCQYKYRVNIGFWTGQRSRNKWGLIFVLCVWIFLERESSIDLISKGIMGKCNLLLV